MKRKVSTVRRVAAIAVSAFIGLIGAVALASPASAHWSGIEGRPYCDETTGEWVVEWKVASYYPVHATEYSLTKVEFGPSGTLTGLPTNEWKSVNDTFTGEQRLAATATYAELTTLAAWNDGFQEKTPFGRGYNPKRVNFQGECKKEEPPTSPSPEPPTSPSPEPPTSPSPEPPTSPSPEPPTSPSPEPPTSPSPEPEPGPISVADESTCENLRVVVENPADGSSAEVTVTAGDDEESFTLEPGQSETFSFTAADGLTYQVTVDGELLAEGAWTDPGDCEAEVEVPIASKADCDSLTVQVTNPLEDEAIDVTVSSGGVTEELTIEPGETTDVSFDAEEGTVATVTIGEESLDIAWEKPDDCDKPGLPVTGPGTTLIAGGALALLALGGGLFLLARRRRITFQA